MRRQLLLISVLLLFGLVWLAGPAYGQTFKVGWFAKTTAAQPASQTVAHGLGETPKALILWTDGKTGTSFGSSYQYGFGITDQSLASYSAAASSQQATTSNTGRRLAAAALTVVAYAGTSVVAEATMTSWDATNFTLKRLEVRGAPRGRGGLRTGNKVPSRIGPTGLEVRGFQRKLDPSAIAIQQLLAGRAVVKLLTREEGWYRVTQPELVAAGLSSKVNPTYLQLFVEGQEQPIRIIGKRDGVFGPGDAIEFYGIGLDTSSTDTRVYWLVEGSKPGKRVELSRSQGSRIVLSSFPYTIEKKERRVYFAALKNGDEGNFFGPLVYPAVQVDQLLEVRHLDPGASEDALLEVALQGVTTVAHSVKVLVNETEVGEVVFEGQSRGFVSLPVSQSLLEEGENVVTLEARGGEMDASVIDTIRLTYWHTYTADDDALKFTAQGGACYIVGRE